MGVDMSKFRREIEKAIAEVQSPKVMQEIGEMAAERIVRRTRLGKGVSERGGTPFPLKALSDDYKAQRKKNREELSALTSAGKSNLTRTGQMLDSIKVIAVKAGSALIGASGRRREGKKTNAEVAGYVSEERPFLNLSAPELNALERFIREKLDNALKRVLT